MLSEPAPIPMLLWCPECRVRHVDAGQFATKSHHTHACQSCGHVWRPALVATCGVQFLPGFRDEPPPKPPLSFESCTACGERLLFGARVRGDGLCGPCSRLCNEAVPGMVHARCMRLKGHEGTHGMPVDAVDRCRYKDGHGVYCPRPAHPGHEYGWCFDHAEAST